MSQGENRNIDNLMRSIQREFGSHQPSQAELTQFVASFGIAEATGLAALLLAGWAWLFPRDPEQSPRCKYKTRVSGFLCRGKIIHTEHDKQSKSLIVICENGHANTISVLDF